MADKFEVDLDVLDGAATAISRTMHAMEQCEVEYIVGPAAQYGHDGMHAAFEHFCDSWQDGVELLVDDGVTISSALNSAVDSYMNSDQSAVHTFRASGTGDDPGMDAVDG